MTYLGIDLHTRNMTICAVSSNGKKTGEWKLANDTDLLNNLIREIGKPVNPVIEATSSWYWLADWAASRNVELILAHAKMLKAIAYAKVKTEPLETPGTQTEEPDASWCESERCLCMEPRQLSGMGGWRVAQSPILKTTITLARMKKRGYIAMLELYHPDRRRGQRNKPPYKRSVRTVV